MNSKFSNHKDVLIFHLAFGLPTPDKPQMLDYDTYKFRTNFIKEEFNEWVKANDDGDLIEAADALVDMVYVIMGTAVMMGLPWERLWDEVQRANMAKERVEAPQDQRSKRKHRLDVVKPEGWIPPNFKEILGEDDGSK